MLPEAPIRGKRSTALLDGQVLGGLFLLVSGSFTENLSIWELITIIKTMLKWDEKNVT